MNAMRFGAYGVVVVLTACAAKSDGGASPGGAVQTPAQAAPVGGRAQPGDTVYLVEHYVRPERREQFEEFVETVLWPAFQRAAATQPTRGRVLRQTRLLRPVVPNEDGSYTFTFVLDPIVPGESYNVLDLLREVYADEEAKQLYGRFTETWARDFMSRPFVQGRESSSS